MTQKYFRKIFDIFVYKIIFPEKRKY